MKHNQFLKVALSAAKKSEQILNKYYTGKLDVKLKPDQSPATIADTKVEKTIIEMIKNKFPDHGFLGEELGSKKSDSEYVWVIDPIDATSNFVRKIPIFSTLIALMRNDELILGVSNAPKLKELIYAVKGEGTFLNGKPIKVSNISKISEATICTGGLKCFLKNGWTTNITNLINDSRRDRHFGDFYNYHLLVSGRIDIVVEGRVEFWDVAPFKVIVEEAGGVMTDVNGNKINNNSASCLATNKLLHNSALKYFEGH